MIGCGVCLVLLHLATPVCAGPMTEILSRLSPSIFHIVYFGDRLILDAPVAEVRSGAGSAVRASK
jgi:hypothetical protein